MLEVVGKVGYRLYVFQGIVASWEKTLPLLVINVVFRISLLNFSSSHGLAVSGPHFFRERWPVADTQFLAVSRKDRHTKERSLCPWSASWISSVCRSQPPHSLTSSYNTKYSVRPTVWYVLLNFCEQVLFYLILIFIPVMFRCVPARVIGWRSEVGFPLWFSPSTLWVLGLELRSDVVDGAFTPGPSHWSPACLLSFIFY